MAVDASTSSAPPADLILVAYVTGAYGVQGWVRIKPYSSDADALFYAKNWWLDKPQLHAAKVSQVKWHSEHVVAKFDHIVGRDAAEALKGTALFIARSDFPALPKGEFYWVDLIGFDIINLAGKHLGVLNDLMDNGAHPILRVTQPGAVDKKDELLIPFVDQFIQKVDQKSKKIVVDWDVDY